MTYTNATEDLKFILALVGEDPTGYGEHSMKRGGATEAARKGATAEDIQIAGDWSSVKTSALYVEVPQSRNQILKKFFQ